MTHFCAIVSTAKVSINPTCCLYNIAHKKLIDAKASKWAENVAWKLYICTRYPVLHEVFPREGAGGLSREYVLCIPMRAWRLKWGAVI